MKIAVFGMGYVGAVSSACLASTGHSVVGVDVNPTKVDLINAGRSPIVEEGIADLVAQTVSAGSLRATTDVAEAIADCDVSFVSVGTPSAPNGSLFTGAVETVSEQIGAALRDRDRPHVVVYRSTLLPGTVEEALVPILTRAAGRPLGEGLQVCFNPEFLREGSSIRDFYQPPFTLVGTGGDAATAEVLRAIYAGVDAPFIETTVRVAESVKYLSNMYHALKICFANEVGTVLGRIGIDAREAMDIFCQDKTLNISKAYLRPGYAFGGSCLPKDLRAFLYMARQLDEDLPMLGHVLDSNARHVERAYEMIAADGRRKVALLGLAFKKGTDDLRESPIVTLAERLIGKGFELRIHDPNVDAARLIGANREFIEREIPHFDKLLVSGVDEALEGAEVIVVANAAPEALERILQRRPRATVVDLQGVDALRALDSVEYKGICW